MKTEIKSWTGETYDDFVKVVRSRFSENSVPFVERLFANPLRSVNPAAGDIAYQDGVPKVVQAAVLRQLYYRQRPYYAVVGSTLGAERDASPVLLMNVMKATISSRSGSVLFYGNTACPASMKMNRLLGVNGAIPSSFNVSNFAYIWSGEAVPYILKKMVGRIVAMKDRDGLPTQDDWSHAFGGGCIVRRMLRFDAKEYDIFWNEYLKHNEGLVSSRTASELNWVYGDRLPRGGIVALGLYRNDVLTGHIILSTEQKKAHEWRVSDWIAIKNDCDSLFLLLRAAKLFLKQRTGALILSSSGFPMFVQKVVRKGLPRVASACGCGTLLKFTDKTIEAQVGELSKSSCSWFFSPYDGDMALLHGRV